MKKLQMALLAACVLLSGAAAPAFAAPTGYFELTNFRISLTDLVPDDGIAPSINYGAYWHHVYGAENMGQFWFPMANYGTSIDGSVSMVGNGGAAQAQWDSQFGLRASVDLSGGLYRAMASYNAGFLLSPNTRAVFSYDWQGLNGWSADKSSQATGYASMVGTANGAQLASSVTDWNGFGKTGSGTLALTVTSGASALQGGVNVETMVDGHAAQAVAVPEPGAAVLMLAGIAGLVAVRRRRA